MNQLNINNNYYNFSSSSSNNTTVKKTFINTEDSEINNYLKKNKNNLIILFSPNYTNKYIAYKYNYDSKKNSHHKYLRLDLSGEPIYIKKNKLEQLISNNRIIYL